MSRETANSRTQTASTRTRIFALHERVVVIGSGATAITLAPALAETAAHVAMLQRSPTYVVTADGECRGR